MRNLRKLYGTAEAVKNVSFDVFRGETVGFLGPNGAGKSTVMNIVTGYLSATSGSVSVCGNDILSEPMAARRKIGYLPEQPPLYNDMRVREYLEFAYNLKKCGKNAKKRAAECMELAGIGDVSGKIIKTLSKGYRQRVGIAQALISDPEILILDEPTAGLDPSQITEFRRLVREAGKTRTVILSTHILQEITALCGRVIIINNGETALDGAVSELARERGCKIAALCTPDAGAELIKSAGAEVVSYSENGNETVFYAGGGEEARRRIFKAFAGAGVDVSEISAERETIEDIYMKAVSGALAGADGEGGFKP